MSDDMSMFKKMKERITDEVNSATNKLQNMQLIDQLSSSIGQQIMVPNQLLPEPQQAQAFHSKQSDKRQFSLLDDGPICGYNEEEELNNSELSPQHQLFNEHTIRRIDTANGGFVGNSNGTNFRTDSPREERTEHEFNSFKIISVEELSSDIEDNLDPDNTNSKDDDIEIDLLSDKPITSNDCTKSISPDHLLQYKTRYRNVIHAFRELHSEFKTKKDELETIKKKLLDRIGALETQLENERQEHSRTELMSNVSEPSSSSSPQPNNKSVNKVKDLERILAKCKESLKLKNAQIKTLKNSLSEVEKFGELNQELKQELNSLREAHEIWTVSIAENKRVMHQEIENKNAEMEQLRVEINELQNKLTDGNNKVRQFKSAIQDLESRLVSTSAAHQKERESLTKELTAMKNNSIRQLQKEHELQLERVKLDLEKSIESLKQELLAKDEMIIKNSQQHQQLQEQYSNLESELEVSGKKLQSQQELNDQVTDQLKKEVEKSSNLLVEIDRLKKHTTAKTDFEMKTKELETDLEATRDQLKSALEAKNQLESQLVAANQSKECDRCDKLHKENLSSTELFQQEIHELNARLELMTTANYDQENEIQSLKNESQSMKQSYNLLKSEFDELLKKNESLARVLRENEIDMQAHQEQMDNLVKIEHELESLKKENVTLGVNLVRTTAELDDRSSDLAQLRRQYEDLNHQLADIKDELDNTRKISKELMREKDSLSSQNELLVKQKKEQDEKLVLKILSAMKNLESPVTSPGSDKSFEAIQKTESDCESGKSLPNTSELMDELLSVALDRNNSYASTTSRLQAVLLENSMFSEEVKRLKEELNNLNREKTLETQYSIEEAEKLRIENQALIRDQQSYDERLAELEEQVQELTKELMDKKTVNSDVGKQDDALPTTTEFEYLKNIVYQFMLGKEPLVLARVISAILKFDKNQFEQVCKVQEAIQPGSKPST